MKAHDGPVALSMSNKTLLSDAVRGMPISQFMRLIRTDAVGGMPSYWRMIEDWHDQTAQRVVEGYERSPRGAAERYGEPRA